MKCLREILIFIKSQSSLARGTWIEMCRKFFEWYFVEVVPRKRDVD